MSYALEGAASVEPGVEGAVATYEDILPGVDVELESLPSGLKETIVLESVGSPSELSFRLDVEGASASLDDEGGVVFTDDGGEVVGAIPAGFMVDSAPGGGAQSDAVTYRLDEREDGTYLVVTPDRAWLEHPDRVWPVRVDPTVTSRNTVDDTYVKQGVNANLGSYAETKVGNDGGAQTATYLKFHFNGTIPTDAFVSDARLHVWNSYSAGGCTPKPVGVYRVTQSWSSATMTTWPGASFHPTPVTTSSFAKGGGAGCPSAWHTFNVTDMVDDWVKEHHPNYGVTLRVPNGSTDAGAYKKFTAQGYSTMEVTWSPWGAAYNPGSSWHNGQASTNNTTGRWPVQVRNIGSQTWPAGGDVRLGTRVYPLGQSTGTPIAQTRTLLPTAVAPGQVVQLIATVPALPPGYYSVIFEMVKEGDFWFAAEGGVRHGINIQVFNQVPVFTDNTPKSGDTVTTRRPTLSVSTEDPDDYGLIIEHFFRICPGPEAPPSFPAGVTGCQSSGWTTADSWTPPNAVGNWNEPMYWWAFVRDRTGPEPRFAAPVLIVPTPDQGEWSTLGRATGSTNDGGVDLRTGNFTSSVTDASVGWGPGTLSVARTYNSRGWQNPGAMGLGWSSIFDVRLDVGTNPAVRPASLVLYGDDGRRETWAQNPVDPNADEEVYRGPLGSGDTLTFDLVSWRYQWRQADGTTYWFTTSGYLDWVSRPGFPRLDFERPSPSSPQVDEVVAGATTLYVEWSGGLVASVRTDADPNAGRWTYTYTSGQLTKVCDPRPAGERGCHAYQHQQFPLAVGGPRGPLQRALTGGEVYLELLHEQASRPRVIWRKDGEGHQWSYGYTTPGCQSGGGTCRVTTVTQPDVAADRLPGEPAPTPLEFRFDRHDRLVRRVDERGHSRRWVYDAVGYLRQQFDENEIGRAYWHDEFGRLYGVTDTRVGTEGSQVFTTTRYHYPQPGTMRVSDPRWTLPTHVWDPRVSDTRPASAATRLTYDTQGRLTATTTPVTPYAPNGMVESVTYDDSTTGRGQVGSTTDFSGRVTAYEYDSEHRLSATVSPSGVRTELTYTDEGWVETSTVKSAAHPAGVTTTFTYDAVGQVVRVDGPPVTNLVDNVTRALAVENTYDPARRLVEQTFFGDAGEPDRTTQWTDFDGNSRPTEVVDPEGNVSTTEWTWRGLPRISEAVTGLRIQQHYTRTGQVARVTSIDAADTAQQNVLAAYAYDPAGRVASAVDARGATTAYTYWDDGRLRRQTLSNYKATPSSTPVARVLGDYSYDLAGNLTHERIRNLTLETVTTYDMANAVTRVDAAGRYTAYGYRSDGLVVSETVGDATRSDLTEYGYDPLPTVALAQVVEHPGHGYLPYVTAYDWDDRGLLTRVSDPNGHTDTTYDALGRPVRTLGPARTVEAYGQAPTTGVRPEATVGYDTFGGVSHVEGPDGATRTTTYDALGRPVTEAGPTYSPEPGVTLDAATTYTYDDPGRARSVTDELRGLTVTEGYDRHGNVVSVEAPPLVPSGGSVVSAYEHSAAGDLVAMVGPEGEQVSWAYDNVGLPASESVTEREGNTGTFTTSYGYDAEFDLTSVTPPATSATTFGHNVFGEVTSETASAAGAGPIQTTYTLDHLGRTVRAADSLGRANQVTYLATGQVIESRDYDGATLVRTEAYGYGYGLNPASVTRPGPNPGSSPVVTAYGVDAAGQVTSITEPGGITTSYGYDVLGRKVRSTDGNGNSTWTTYTPWGDVEAVVDPATTAHPAEADRTWSYTWQAPGLVDTATAPGGVTRSYDYDTAGNLTSEAGTGGDASASRSFAWDRSGRLTEAASPLGAQAFDWDDRGNLLAAAGPAGTSSFGYDAASRMTSRTDGAATSTFTYWSNGLLHTATGNLTGATETYSYDSAGQLATIGYPAGTSRSFTYDALGNPTSDTLVTNSTTLATQSWTWAPDGQRLAATTAGPAPLVGSGVESYTYDAAGRLVTTTRPGSTTATTWDNAGNRTSNDTTTATYDERNRLLTSTTPGGTDTYAWTARGTLDSVTTTAGVTDYSFDALDRLIEEDGPSGVDTYEWDGLDRLASVDGTPFGYAGLERDPVTLAGEAYERGPGGGLRATKPAGDPAVFVRNNQRGDAAATFTPGATSVTSNRHYTPFGETTTNGTPQPAAGYQGDWTSDSGLVHMDARFYNPATGTFISRDTWDNSPGTSAHFNRYTYADGMPTSATDPMGTKSIIIIDPCKLFPWRCIGIIVGGLLNTPKHITNQPATVHNTGAGSGGGSGSGGGGGSGGRGGGSGARSASTPAPKPPPKPVRPWWTTVTPTTPPPTGQFNPSLPQTPIIEATDLLYRNPLDVPLATYLPSTSASPYTASLLANEAQAVEYSVAPRPGQQASPADSQPDCGPGEEPQPVEGTPTINDVYMGTVTRECVPYSDHDKDLYKAFYDEIVLWAEHFGLDPRLLGAVLQHEGYGIWQFYRRWGKIARVTEFGLPVGSVGIAGVEPATGRGLWEQYTGNELTDDDVRGNLVLDDEFSIYIAAANLSRLKSEFELSDRQAFQAYAFSDARVREMVSHNFSIFTESRRRGRKYDILLREMDGVFEP